MSSHVPNLNLGATCCLEPNPDSELSSDLISGVQQSTERLMTGDWVEVDAQPFCPASQAAASFSSYQSPLRNVAPSAPSPEFELKPRLSKQLSTSEPSDLTRGNSRSGFWDKPSKYHQSDNTRQNRNANGYESHIGSSASCFSQSQSSQGLLSQSQSSLNTLSTIYEVDSNLNLFGEVQEREQYYAESESEDEHFVESMTESDEQGGVLGRNDRTSARDGRARGREAGANRREGERGNQHHKHKKKTRHTEQRHSHSSKKGKKTNRVAARRLYVELRASSDESSSSDSDLGQVITHSHQHHEKAAVQNQSVNWGSKGVKKPPPYQENEDKFSDPEEPSTSTQRKKKKKKSKCCSKISTRKKAAGFFGGLVVGIGATAAFIRSGGAGATAVAGFFGFAGAVNSGSTVEGNNNTVIGAGGNGLVNWNEMYVPPNPELLDSLIKRNQIQCLQAGMVLKDPADDSWWGWSLKVDGPVCLMNIPSSMYKGACRLVGDFLKERDRLDSSAPPPIAVPNLEPQVGDPPATNSTLSSPAATSSSSSTGAGSSTGGNQASGVNFVSQRSTSRSGAGSRNSPRFASGGEDETTNSANDQAETQALLDNARGIKTNRADQAQGEAWLRKARKKH